MSMDGYVTRNVDFRLPELGEIHSNEGAAFDSNDVGEIGSAMEVLTRVDLDLAYSSEKLANLEKVLMHVLACENDLEAMALDNDNNSINLMEKALVFDFLSGFLDSEVNELESFVLALHPVIVDAHHKLFAFSHLKEIFIVMEGKLRDSEELLNQSQEQVSEISKQSSKLQNALLALKQNDWKCDGGAVLSENGEVENTDEKLKMRIVEQKRHILRMLEKSLGRELNLEKKLSEFKQNEEDLKLKLRLTEKVAVCMEEAAEVVWGRFLEAENAAEVLMGISKEMVDRLQIFQFNVNGSTQREKEVNLKLLYCMEQLENREASLMKLESNMAELIKDNSEVCALRKEVKFLEEQLKESESQLKNANVSNEAKEEHLREMNNIIESLKENISTAESRAESAESKIAHLEETNMELNEEQNFLKNAHDSNAKKVSLLEKQLREFEVQLQHARASSEASQEQQNMLYSAIWDMETLIEELKSKVSKAEIKTENTEERCAMLSETNLDLNKEVIFLRTKVECLEASLEQANDDKVGSAKDINVKTKLFMDMVMQLAMEREHIQKRLSSLAEANKVLVAKLQNSERRTSVVTHEQGRSNGEMSLSGKSSAVPGEASEDAAIESFSRNFQAAELSQDARAPEAEVGPSVSTNDDAVLKVEPETAGEAGEPSGHNQMFVLVAILVLLGSMLASFMLNKKSLV
ncbi:WPP domain-interacting tail-anchored protein 2 isoform X2 [Diospyros lotus]|nr:WPP domain-interacting tail-anchored protein 2 isoform X2 [Diospyros lotus]XP_052200228.1 WPP domain-interacting tail-anchored protein 2 isoform X2 [Diospyros lotus]